MPVDQQKMLQMIAREPLIRTMALADRLDCDIEQMDAALAPHLASGLIVAQTVPSPNGRTATGYRLSDAERSAIREAAPGVRMHTPSNIDKAIAFVRDNPGATSAQLHALLGLPAEVMVSAELAPALADGRLVKDGKNWVLISEKIANSAVAPAVELKPYTPPVPRATNNQIAVEYLQGRPGNRCTHDQMRIALDLPAGGQPGPLLKTILTSGRVLRDGTDWILAPVVVVPRFLEAPAALTTVPLPTDDEPEALTFAPLGGIGDVNSQEKGSGARYNTGKPPFELIPAALIAKSIGEQTPPNRAMELLGVWQEGGGQDTLVEIFRVLGLDGWVECAHVFDYGRKKYAAWNWAKGMPWSAPFACAQRHLLAMIAGEELDPESGLPHRGHVFCNVVMLCTYHRTYLVGDDRPTKELLS